jgi:hypothetical protein
MTKKTQDILHTFFTKEVEDLTPVDYQEYVADKSSDFPTLPAGTVVLASGNNGQDADLLVVRTPDNIYHLVDEEDEDIIELAETPYLDPKSDDIYSIEHYDDNGTHYHYTSYTSYTGIILHQLIDEDDYYCGGFYIFNKEYTGRRKA